MTPGAHRHSAYMPLGAEDRGSALSLLDSHPDRTDADGEEPDRPGDRDGEVVFASCDIRSAVLDPRLHTRPGSPQTHPNARLTGKGLACYLQCRGCERPAAR
jgi:hypothetical protein